MDRSAAAQNIDRSSECEIMNLRRLKFVSDVSPLEIIDDKELFEEDENFFPGATACPAAAAAAAVEMMNIDQINLGIHAVNHDLITQYWSLKSNQLQHQFQQLQLNSSSSSSSSSSCRYQQYHRDHHHLRDDDDDEEMIMITCRPACRPKTADPIILLDRGVFASSSDDDDEDCMIMSQLSDVDLLYEIEWISKQEQLEEVKRCIVQRISEAKPALLLLAKTKALRIRVDLSRILKRYYANPAAAASAYAEDEHYNNTVVAEAFAIHYPVTSFYDDDDDKPLRTPLITALRSSKEALETKILEEEDLITSSSSSSISSSCSICLDEFRVGVDEIKKMPCSHVFHWTCLMNWLCERNTCPLCYYELPTFLSRFVEKYQLP